MIEETLRDSSLSAFFRGGSLPSEFARDVNHDSKPLDQHVLDLSSST
jgi:hypothetical protein